MTKIIKVVIWGASGHAAGIREILESSGNYQVVGFLDDINLETHGSLYRGLPILGGRDQLFKLREEQGIEHVAMGIGQCAARLILGPFLMDHGFHPVTCIHPQTIIGRNVSIGDGTVVMAGAIINSGSSIGKFSIINTGAIIDHECRIGDGVHIAPGVNLAGNVQIEDGTWVGIGSCVIEKIRIGAKCLIGAGSVVVEDIPSGVVAFGNPARKIRDVSEAF